MNNGLQPQHLALRIGNNYYSPAQFADAWVAVTERSKLKEIVDKEVEKIIANNFVSTDTPILAELVKKKHDDNGIFGIKDLESIATKSYGTAKIISNSELTLRDGTDDFSFSVRDNIRAKIDRREKRTAKKSGQRVSLHNQIYSDINEIIDKFYFEGGTEHAFYASDKLSHWSEGIIRENKHLKNIESKFGKLAVDKYYARIQIVDSAIAHLMIYVHNELDKKKMDLPSRLEFDVTESTKAFLPFNFDKAPELAIENFLRVNCKLKGRSKKVTRGKRYFVADKELIKHFDRFTSKEYIDLIKQGKASIEIFISGKNFPYFDPWPNHDFSWAIIQAFEEHMHERKREFVGFSLEKIGDYDFAAIAFRNTARDKRQTSVRIIYDDMFLPVVLYKTVTGDDLRTGTELHPMKLLNFSKPRNKYDIIYRDIDLKSGKKTINELFEPLPELIHRASQIIFENNIKQLGGVNFKNEQDMSKYILHRYITRRKEYSKISKI